MRQPMVSVCMPTRNQDRFIGDALRSVLTQTLADFEVVVHDDASSEATRDVVASFDDPRVRYLRHPDRIGIAANRNSCLAAARGRYIAWLDSDDVYRPDMLERQIGILERHPEAAFAHAAFEVIDESGKRLPDWPRPFQHDHIERSVDAFHELLAVNYVTAPTVVARRDAHQRAGSYAAAIGPSSTDWDMWLRLALVGDVAYSSQVLAAYRQHAASTSARTIASGDRLASDVAVVRHVLARQRRQIPDLRRARRIAQAGLAARALLAAGDLLTRHRRVDSLRAAVLALRSEPALMRSAAAPRVVAAIAVGDGYRAYRSAKALLGRLHARLAGTRYAERLAKVALDDPAWERALTEIAQTVRRVTPPEARLGVIDKWDPTLLHLSRRRGLHFPDRRLLPDGYPAHSPMAVEHLERLRAEGIDHLVIPSVAFWWLDHYTGLREHLARYTRVWKDDRCVVYALQPTARIADGDGRR